MIKKLAILGITLLLITSCQEAVKITSDPKDTTVGNPDQETPVNIEKPEFDLYLYLNYYDDNKERLLNISKIQEFDIKREDFTGKYLPPIAPYETLTDELHKKLFAYLNQESFDSITQERKLGPIVPTSFQITDIYKGLYIKSVVTSNTQNKDMLKKLLANMSYPQSTQNIWTHPIREFADNEFQISERLVLQFFTAETKRFSYATDFSNYLKTDYQSKIGDSWFNKFLAGAAYTVYKNYTIRDFGSYSIDEISTAQLVLNNLSEYTEDDIFWAKSVVDSYTHEHIDLFYILDNYSVSDEMFESADFQQFISKKQAIVDSFSGGFAYPSHQDQQGHYLKFPKDVIESLSKNNKINVSQLNGFGYTYKPYTLEMINNFTQ